jgi:hypothetical protein
VQVLKAQHLATIPRLAEVSLDPTTLAFGFTCSIVGSVLFSLVAIVKCGLPGKLLNARGMSTDFGQLRA